MMSAMSADILVLLMFHWKPKMKLYTLTDVSKKRESERNIWKIEDLVKACGDIITSHILFIHAWSGCDTTSDTYGQGAYIYIYICIYMLFLNFLKFVYMAHHFIMLRLNPFDPRVDREGWWFEHSVS